MPTTLSDLFINALNHTYVPKPVHVTKKSGKSSTYSSHFNLQTTNPVPAQRKHIAVKQTPPDKQPHPQQITQSEKYTEKHTEKYPAVSKTETPIQQEVLRSNHYPERSSLLKEKCPYCKFVIRVSTEIDLLKHFQTCSTFYKA